MTDVGALSVECSHCGTLKFSGETDLFCGNVQLEPFPQPQSFLQHFYEDTQCDSNHFLKNI